jgi:hypothetical protein
VRRLAKLAGFDPPVDIASHHETKRLLEPSPPRKREYKQREDLLRRSHLRMDGCVLAPLRP